MASEHRLVITFPRPYGGVEVSHPDGELVIEIPFTTKASADIARGEMAVFVRAHYQVIDGEVVEDGDGG